MVERETRSGGGRRQGLAAERSKLNGLSDKGEVERRVETLEDLVRDLPLLKFTAAFSFPLRPR